MRLLVVDNYDSFTWNLVHYLEEIIEGDVTVLRNDELESVTVNDYDRVVISPGPGLPRESGKLMDFLGSVIGTIPVLGVCLGLQAIVEFSGGKLIRLPQVLHGLQRRCTHTGDDPLFLNIPFDFTAGRYHSWVADNATFPDILEVIARDEDQHVMALRNKRYRVHAVQFHPESVLTPEGKQMLFNWVEYC
jgi:anthranilate synthase/aminodeoxychorismate synthase-like glutamine amidotransferase